MRKLLTVLASAALAGCSALKIKTIGSPIANAHRTPTYVATLISTLEPYVPSLHRDPRSDRYRIGLLLLFHSGERRVVPIIGNTTLSSGHRILGFDGRLLWFSLDKIRAYDADADRLIEDREPPPHFNEIRMSALHDPADAYIDGMSLEKGDWFGLRPTRPGTRDQRLTRVTKDGARTLSDTVYRAGALLRLPAERAPLRLSQPDGFLLAYRSTYLRAGTMMVTRIDLQGKAVWTVDTGVGDFEQILPDSKAFAFIGHRPEENKVGDHLLVMIDNASGAVTSRSLLVK